MNEESYEDQKKTKIAKRRHNFAEKRSRLKSRIEYNSNENTKDSTEHHIARPARSTIDHLITCARIQRRDLLVLAGERIHYLPGDSLLREHGEKVSSMNHSLPTGSQYLLTTLNRNHEYISTQ